MTDTGSDHRGPRGGHDDHRTDRPGHRIVDRGQATAFRGPKMVPFLFSGAVLGVLLAGVLHFFGPEPPNGGTVQDLILMSVLFAGLGGLGGGLAFLAAERFTRR